jgi:hypothetical protein
MGKAYHVLRPIQDKCLDVRAKIGLQLMAVISASSPSATSQRQPNMMAFVADTGIGTRPSKTA